MDSKSALEDIVIKAEEAFKNGQSQEALNLMSRVLSEEPENFRALIGFGVMCHSCGQFGKATEAFEKILALDENHYEARRNLVLSLTSIGQLPKAQAHLEKLLASNQNNPFLWELMARLEKNLGHTQAAKEHASRSLLLNPNQPELKLFVENLSEPDKPATLENFTEKRLILCCPSGRENQADILVEELSSQLAITKITSLNYDAYLKALDKGGMVWLDGIGEFVVRLSRETSLLKGRRVLLRLEEKDLLDKGLSFVNFECITDILMESPAAREFFISTKPPLKPGTNIHILPKAINVKRYPYKADRGKLRIAAVSALSQSTDPLFLLQGFFHLHRLYPETSLSILGSFETQAIEIAVTHFIRLNQLTEPVTIYGPGTDLKSFLQGSDFIIRTGFLGGYDGLWEALAMGLRPLVYFSPWSDGYFPSAFLWSNFNSLVDIFEKGPEPEIGRDLVNNNHSPVSVAARFLKIIRNETN